MVLMNRAVRIPEGLRIITRYRNGESPQGRAYERYAIEAKPLVLHGGLTRTEIKPAAIPRYKAARVPH